VSDDDWGTVWKKVDLWTNFAIYGWVSYLTNFMSEDDWGTVWKKVDLWTNFAIYG
jgi:hypothetical protein